jgi:hypothetical protein
MFCKKGRGRCSCVYGTKGAVDRQSLGTTGLYIELHTPAASEFHYLAQQL